jgi:uncharacterized protein YijF (DUF1287 family)
MGVDVVIVQPKNMNIPERMGVLAFIVVQAVMVADAPIAQRVNTNMKQVSESVFIVVQQVLEVDAAIVHMAGMNIETIFKSRGDVENCPLILLCRKREKIN